MSAGKNLGVMLLAALLLVPVTANAGDQGTVRKASELKNEPYRDARAIGALVAGDRVEILRKRGGWYQVRSVRGNGWVRMLSVRRGEARKGGAVDAAELLALATGRAGTGQVVSATGIRGLSEEELKSAKYDASEVRKLELFGVTPAQAREFAASGGLKPRDVD